MGVRVTDKDPNIDENEAAFILKTEKFSEAGVGGRFVSFVRRHPYVSKNSLSPSCLIMFAQ